jgi:2-polyprenyl-3-methyl-5-hydroxy-6-metoxy-1,4-benzoquinol methylase
MKKIASNKEWKKWGETDPLFGVASWQNKARDGSSPWTDQEFYQLGASDWGDFSSHWEKYGLNRESCLEIGCGAGRITLQLAAYFNQVHALDISEKMMSMPGSIFRVRRLLFMSPMGLIFR